MNDLNRFYQEFRHSSSILWGNAYLQFLRRHHHLRLVLPL